MGTRSSRISYHPTFNVIFHFKSSLNFPCSNSAPLTARQHVLPHVKFTFALSETLVMHPTAHEKCEVHAPFTFESQHPSVAGQLDRMPVPSVVVAPRVPFPCPPSRLSLIPARPPSVVA